MPDLLTDLQFDEFRKLIYDTSGITFSETNRSILDSRLKERLREKKIDDVQQYYKMITTDLEEFKKFLDSITTNLTRFFRNQPHFDALINYVIPHVIAEKKKVIRFPLNGTWIDIGNPQEYQKAQELVKHL